MLGGKIYPLELWKKNLHLTRNQFFNLTNELQRYISLSLLSSKHRALNADKKLTLTLYYFEDIWSLIMTANNFGVAINAASSVWSCMKKFVWQFLRIWGHNIFVCLKQGKKWGRRYLNLKQSLEWCKLLGVLMALIPIKCPLENSQIVLFIKCTDCVRL